MDPTRWLTLMEQLTLPPSLEVYQQLWSAYREPHRYYHTVEHITDCLQQLDLVKSLAQSPAEVELALWFHDAVYQPKAQDNEAQSAAWAIRFLQTAIEVNRIPADIQQTIHSHIMATQHQGAAYSSDTTLVVDIDLSILGREADQFEQFEDNIRQEYQWVSAPLYRQKRCAILTSFLDRATIYETVYFQERYEKAARQNLERAIAKLSK